VSEPPDEDWRSLETFSFGDGAELAEALAQLVVSGTKTATCWPVSDGPQTAIGKRMVMLDGAGRPRAVIETVELNQRRFNHVDARFAHDEAQATAPSTTGAGRTATISPVAANSLRT